MAHKDLETILVPLVGRERVTKYSTDHIRCPFCGKPSYTIHIISSHYETTCCKQPITHCCEGPVSALP